MTDLKTLKDLDCYEKHKGENWKTLKRPEEILRELRQEAIKWVKHLAKSELIEDNDKVNWIMHFFNITEEELQK
jgi:DNA phosphorothioation-dependent restriction protein DptG